LPFARGGGGGRRSQSSSKDDKASAVEWPEEEGRPEELEEGVMKVSPTTTTTTPLCLFRGRFILVIDEDDDLLGDDDDELLTPDGNQSVDFYPFEDTQTNETRYLDRESLRTCSLPPPSMTRPAPSVSFVSGRQSSRRSLLLTGTNATSRPPTLSSGVPAPVRSRPMARNNSVSGDTISSWSPPGPGDDEEGGHGLAYAVRGVGDDDVERPPPDRITRARTNVGRQAIAVDDLQWRGKRTRLEVPNDVVAIDVTIVRDFDCHRSSRVPCPAMAAIGR
jgi:hypothetical protein